jgi:hypothetical protein
LSGPDLIPQKKLFQDLCGNVLKLALSETLQIINVAN